MAERDIESGGLLPATGNQYNSHNHHQDRHLQQTTHSEDSWKRHSTSWLVPMFVVANVIAFVVAMFVNNCPRNNLGVEGSCTATFLGRFSFQPIRENPLFGPSSSTLEKLGALEWGKIVHEHQGWRLITCIWLHAGIVHLVANMMSLVVIGIRLEQQFGFVRVGLIYLLSGFAGSILSSLFIQRNISVGASGALFGLLGAMLSELLTNWTIYSNKTAALITLVLIILVNLAMGILPHVDNFAHIGGFLTGFFLGFILLIQPQLRWSQPSGTRDPDTGRISKYKVYQCTLCVVALLVLIVGFTVGLIMLFRGDSGNDHCQWCHYLTCVPTSKWKCQT